MSDMIGIPEDRFSRVAAIFALFDIKIMNHNTFTVRTASICTMYLFNWYIVFIFIILYNFVLMHVMKFSTTMSYKVR